MSFVPPVEPAQAGPLQKKLLALVARLQGFASNIDLLAARVPRVLWILGIGGEAVERGGRLAKREQAMIQYVVARENACPYCVPAMGVMLRGLGLTDAEIAHLREQVENPFKDERTNLLLDLAHRSVRDSHRYTQADRDRLRTAGLGEAQAVEAIFAACKAAATNRFATALQTDLDAPLKLATRPILGRVMMPLMRLMMRKAFREPPAA